jgi:hypothetical protein
MIEHIVLFEIKKGTSQKEIDDMVTALRGLKDKVPGVLELSVGPNLSQYNQCHTHGLILRVKDRLALQGFDANAEVQEVVRRYCMPISESICVADLEV